MCAIFCAKVFSTNYLFSCFYHAVRIMTRTYSSRCQFVKSRNARFFLNSPPVHPCIIALLLFYLFQQLLSFPLYFFSFSPRLLQAARVWWLALLDKPLSPTRPRRPSPPHTQSFPIRFCRHIHPRVSLRRHSIQPRRDATPRSISTRRTTTTTLQRRAKCRSKSLPCYFARQDRFLCTQRQWKFTVARDTSTRRTFQPQQLSPGLSSGGMYVYVCVCMCVHLT